MHPLSQASVEGDPDHGGGRDGRARHGGGGLRTGQGGLRGELRPARGARRRRRRVPRRAPGGRPVGGHQGRRRHRALAARHRPDRALGDQGRRRRRAPAAAPAR
ncbi:hypothetical protein SGPA1_50947 [Streptomyces misionensis JCM 4497]